jgi:hypothetical protein
MSTISNDLSDYYILAMETPFNAVAVKSLAKEASGFPLHTGRITCPHIVIGDVANDKELLMRLRGTEEVVVTAHADLVCEPPFVWRGTPDEFAQEWKGD